MSDLPQQTRYYGKYRGTVVNNVDPMQIGRIQAIVPAVSNVVPTSWAMPCVPVAGVNTGVFTVPPGNYFAMGDNRDNSQDSRTTEVGFVPAANLVGRAEFLLTVVTLHGDGHRHLGYGF